MGRLAELESELRQVQGRLMRWPMSARYQYQARELRRAIERERETWVRALRGGIRRALMELDEATLEMIHTQITGHG